MKPFVKWVGGKNQLLEELHTRMPKEYRTYYEPFLGGGALFLYEEPEQAIINDANRELVHVWRVVRDAPEELLLDLAELDEKPCTKESYLSCRKRYNEKIIQGTYDIELAALFVYLNKHCFNGLYRTNREGRFNVPWNNRKSGSSVDQENLLEISGYLKRADIGIRGG